MCSLKNNSVVRFCYLAYCKADDDLCFIAHEKLNVKMQIYDKEMSIKPGFSGHTRLINYIQARLPV